MHTKPGDIERTSLSIIRRELEARGIVLPEETAAVVKRVIHATADLDYAENLRFTDGAVARGVEALRRGRTLVTDTNMALAGVSKPALSKLGGKALCLMAEPAVAAEAMMSAAPRQLDIGRWNERYFVYVASFGAFTKSSYSAPQAAKNALGHFAYILEGMKDLNTLRPYQVKLTADGEVLNGEYLFGAVCNSTSIGGLMKLDPERVVLDDGKFELLLVPNPRTALDLQNLVVALLNQQYDSEGLVFRHVSSIHLETEEDLPWSLDGEYAPSAAKVNIHNHQAALRMLL